jgi:predicted TIM-barrel fold metal-dependent hydrolase
MRWQTAVDREPDEVEARDVAGLDVVLDPLGEPCPGPRGRGLPSTTRSGASPPGDVHPRPRPGALYDYFAGKSDRARLGDELACEDPAAHPEWFDRDARLRVMDDQGVEAAWLFPSQGVCMEGPMQPDTEAAIHILGAFNRWIEEDWGFAYQDRLFGVPFLTLSDVDRAVVDLDWCLDRGARVVSIRNGPAFTPEGTRSPADPRFDPFWARIAEAGVVVAPHAGFEDGYVGVTAAVAAEWGRSATSTGMGDAAASSVISMLMKRRLVHDFAAILVADKLFERHPGVRVAYIENGGTWVGDLLHDLQVLHGQNPGMFTRNPVDQFHRCCWVAPSSRTASPTWPATSPSSASCSARTGPTPKAWATPATSSPTSPTSPSTTNAASWSTTPAPSPSPPPDYGPGRGAVGARGT